MTCCKSYVTGILGIVALLCVWPWIDASAVAPQTPVLGDTLSNVIVDAPASAARLSGHDTWVTQLIRSGFHINDPAIRYPKFAKWCVGVYNWGNRLFNTYDSVYVVGTGKNWKFNAKPDVWGRGYMMYFDNKEQLQMRSDLYSDLGVYLSFMAVSVGSSFSSNIFGASGSRHRWDFSFTCSRIAASFTYQQTDGGSHIIKFGNYQDGQRIYYPFDDLSVRELQADAYYFWNNKRYAQAAAYCFSKYQLRSAGSWMLGLCYHQQRLSMDFSSLPPEMLECLPNLERQYLFRNSDYTIVGGYGYNFVIEPRKWLVNLTLLPGVGYKNSSENRSDNHFMTYLSTNLVGMGSLVYNHRALYASLQVKGAAYVNYSTNYTFTTATGIATAFIGVRF